jgi:hypothetical protein
MRSTIFGAILIAAHLDLVLTCCFSGSQGNVIFQTICSSAQTLTEGPPALSRRTGTLLHRPRAAVDKLPPSLHVSRRPRTIRRDKTIG